MGLDRNNMMRNRIFILLCIFFSIYTWASAIKNYRVQNISWSRLRCDTALNIKNIQDMKLMGNNELYVTYEIPNSYGDQLVNSLSVDLSKRNLSFKKSSLSGRTEHMYLAFLSFFGIAKGLCLPMSAIIPICMQ